MSTYNYVSNHSVFIGISSLACPYPASGVPYHLLKIKMKSEQNGSLATYIATWDGWLEVGCMGWDRDSVMWLCSNGVVESGSVRCNNAWSD